MLQSDLYRRPAKGRSTTEPLVHHHTQSVLVTRCPWFALQLFWSQVRRGSRYRLIHHLRTQGACVWRKQSEAEVAEQDFGMCSEQHVFRLDIAVHEPLVMGIL